jgi:hypothetical protein
VIASHFLKIIFCLLLAVASEADAQWWRVTQLPASDIYAVYTKGDTIAAAADTTVFISTNAGATWKTSARPAADVTTIRAVLVHNGRLYAGTSGQGVFISPDLGTGWFNYSQGLVGGIGNSVLTISGLVQHGGDLYAATQGAGAWTRNLLSGDWARFGDHTIEENQASNLDAIAAGGSRLFATGGFNGTVFYRDPGQLDWTVSLLFNDRLAPGLAGLNAIWTGRRWIVGTNIGIFYSDTGQEPWTYVDIGAPLPFFVGLAMNGDDVYASFASFGSSLIARSHDDGSTWEILETLPASVYRIAVGGSKLYAGRVDGLWHRPAATSTQPTRWTSVKSMFR